MHFFFLLLPQVIGAKLNNEDLLSIFVPKTILPKQLVPQFIISEYDNWHSFQHGPENPHTPFARFQITSTSPSLLLMTSYVLPGASFSFQLNQAPLQSTSQKPSNNKVGQTNDPQSAYDGGYFSRKTLVLDIGTSYLDVRVAKSPFVNGLMAVKLVRLLIDPKYHADYFMVWTPILVSLANRTCQVFASHLVHLDQKQLIQVKKLYGVDAAFYIGGYEERQYDGSPLIVLPGNKVKVSDDIWNYKQAMVLCYRRYPPKKQQ